VLVRERVRLGNLVLALATRLDQLNWTEAAENFCARASVMRSIDPDFPDLSRPALAAVAGTLSRGEQKSARGQNHGCLRAAARHFIARPGQKAGPRPAGRTASEGRHRAHRLFRPGTRRLGACKIFYGTDATPKLANGKIPLQLALLSPAQRPIAITADLAAFWRGGWADARKDVRGRYPRHDWPEEPWNS
jgi:ATP-dependent helicase HrpB